MLMAHGFDHFNGNQSVKRRRPLGNLAEADGFCSQDLENESKLWRG